MGIDEVLLIPIPLLNLLIDPIPLLILDPVSYEKTSMPADFQCSTTTLSFIYLLFNPKQTIA